MIRILTLKTLTRAQTQTQTPTQTLAHNLLQQCSVSGTAKGKAKTKTGQTFKKSKVATTKSGTTDGGPTTRKTSLANELEEMAKKCLSSPTPIRFLKPKQRHREAEREKLGLVSKERQREIENIKKQAKNGTGFENPMIMGTPGLDYISLGLVDVEKLPKYDLTVEDGRRLAKEYSRVLMRKHRARQKAETNLLNMKKAAIEALPEKLKMAALVPDLTPFPPNRFMATLTPPIEGYVDKINKAAERSQVKEKLR